MSSTIALMGECMIEMHGRPGQSIHQTFGGDSFNTAAYLARLAGKALNVEYVTALGSDGFSQAMRERFTQEGVGTNNVRTLETRLPGLYFIETDETGERRFHYWRSEAAARFMFDGEEGEQLLEGLAHHKTLYLSGISLAILTAEGRERLLARLPALRERGVTVVFDNNYRPRLWPNAESARQAHQALLAQVDLAIVTFEDDQALFGLETPEALFAFYRDQGVGEIVIKRGAESCLIECEGVRHEVAGERVEKVVDTTAAGDSFSAGYLACRLTGGDVEQAARWGHRLAATVIGHRGAIIDVEHMPDMP
ncbi:sugar kinase [Kushneria indalinina]|uniref:2-dehydro-3-deoxygluconokinase n=1 Tax=Kushneria indalinina DSM 14324 TaxID=1122140 RepID=A0A3D9DTV6_9GAMM|nr:sugar kinase [Kushneria indalinina]REC94157.1 2-keto-3-deoxygluconate kinase [Kushneria indalinina DSM 14324]